MLRPYRDLMADAQAPRELPTELRELLLQIPASTPARGPWRILSSPIRPPSFLLRSPALAAIASYVLVVVIFALGDPYRMGRETLADLRATTEPVVSRGLDFVADLKSVGSDLEAQVDATLGAIRSQHGRQ